ELLLAEVLEPLAAQYLGGAVRAGHAGFRLAVRPGIAAVRVVAARTPQHALLVLLKLVECLLLGSAGIAEAQFQRQLDAPPPEQVKGAVEQLDLIRGMHEEGSQRVVEVVLPREVDGGQGVGEVVNLPRADAHAELPQQPPEDRKSTRLNSSHVKISYSFFYLKKKKE